MSSTHSATFYIWRSGMIVLDWRISNTFLICKLCDNRCQATAFLGPFFSRMSNNAHSRSKSMGKWSLKSSQNTFVRCNKWTFVFVQIISVSILRQQRFSLILITSSDTPTHYFLEFFRSILGRCGSCWLKGHRGFFFCFFRRCPKLIKVCSKEEQSLFLTAGSGNAVLEQLFNDGQLTGVSTDGEPPEPCSDGFESSLAVLNEPLF